MANILRTSELFEDDYIDRLIAKLNALGKAYEDNISKIKSEAADLQKVVEGINVTTAAGREENAKAAKQADELAKANARYESALAENKTQIEEVKQATQTLNQLKKNEARFNLAAEGSYNQLAAKYNIIKLNLNAMSKAERENTKEGQALVKQSKDIYEEMKRLQGETGKMVLNVGNYTESVREAINSSQIFSGQLGFLAKVQNVYQAAVKATATAKASMTAATGGTTSALKAFRIALISTGIGAIVVLLGTLIAAFLSTQEGVDALNRVLVPLKTVFEGLWGAIQNLAIRGFGALKKAIEDPIGTLKEFGNTIQEYLIGKLEAFGRIGKALGRILSGEIKEGFKDLGKAASDLSVVNDVAKAIGNLANETGKVIKENWKLGKSIDAMRVQLREEEIAFESRKAALERQVAAGRELAADQGKNAAQREAGLNSALGALNKLQKAEESIAKKRVQLAKLEATASDTDAEGRREIQRLEGELIRTETDNLNKRKELVSQLSGIRKQAAAAEAAASKAQQDARLKELESEKGFQLAKFDNETDYGNKSEDYQRARSIMRFMIEQETNRAILAEQRKFNRITEQQYQTGLLELEAKLKEFTARIQGERSSDIATIPGISYGKKAEDLVLKRVREISDAAAKQARDTLEANKDKKFSIYSLLGIEGDDQQNAANTALQSAKASLNEYIAAIQKVADERIKASERAIAAAENEYNRQTQLQSQGLANNAETARQELELAKQNQRKALEEQRRAQRQQILIQSVEQASNLVTAISKVYATLGFPAGLIASGLMIGAFAAAKIKALQATKTEFAEGGFEFIGGGSHASGKDTPLGFTSKGKPAYAERGEFHGIVRKEQVPKYKSVLPGIINALNAGTFEQQFQRVNAAGQELRAVVVNNTSQSDLRRTEDYLRQLVEQGQANTVINGNVTVSKWRNWTSTVVRH